MSLLESDQQWAEKDSSARVRTISSSSANSAKDASSGKRHRKEHKRKKSHTCKKSRSSPVVSSHVLLNLPPAVFVESSKPSCISSELSEPTEPKALRDEWLSTSGSSFLFPSVSRNELQGRSRDKKLAAKIAQQEETARIYRTRELNPDLSGQVKTSIGTVKSSGSSPGPTVLNVTVGDGGLSWLRRSYQRVQEQVSENN